MVTIPKPGSFVEIITSRNGTELKQKGTVLPRGELFAPGILVLKLENGYNVGIKTESISQITVLEEPKTIEKEVVEIKEDSSLPTVAFLSFGGTISSRLDYKTGGVVADYTANDFYEMMPELASIANIRAQSVANKMSEDMDFADYEKMAEVIQPLLADDSITGIVMTQGTDTLHYSTAALSFLLGKLNKPVVFTASQRSIDRGSSDAFENVICAVRAAASWDGANVVTCMHEKSDDGACLLIRGTKVRKMHTSRRDAFRPINEQALARITLNGELTIINDSYPKVGEVESYESTKSTMEKHIGLLYVYPGINVDQITFFDEKKYKGLVIAATALGHVPESVLSAVQDLAKKIPVIISSQTLYGRVHPLVYARLRQMSIAAEMLFVEDMLPEVAYAKLGFVLGQTSKREEVFTLMKENIAGEYAGEIDEMSYLN